MLQSTTFAARIVSPRPQAKRLIARRNEVYTQHVQADDVTTAYDAMGAYTIKVCEAVFATAAQRLLFTKAGKPRKVTALHTLALAAAPFTMSMTVDAHARHECNNAECGVDAQA